jgi:hypothetical protein
MTGRLGDLLLLALDTGIQYGSGLPLERHPDAEIDALLQQTIDRWHRESQAAQSWHDASTEPRLAADDIPGWLLSLPRQELGHE